MRRLLRLLVGRREPVASSAEPDASFSRPAFEEERAADTVELKVYLPGVDPAAVDVAVEDDDLVVTACRPRGIRANFSAAHLEARLRDYRLRAHLGADVAIQALRAEFVDGILRVVLPLARGASAGGPALQVRTA